MSNDIEDRVIKILGTHLGADEDIVSDTSLIELGVGVDSVSTLELIVMIENEFNITINESDITPDMFFTPAAIARFVRKYI